jgi:hypothetical protein
MIVLLGLVLLEELEFRTELTLREGLRVRTVAVRLTGLRVRSGLRVRTVTVEREGLTRRTETTRDELCLSESSSSSSSVRSSLLSLVVRTVARDGTMRVVTRLTG